MILLLLLPAAVLGVSYAAVCLESGRLWPWAAVVHEDGVRTFGQTVLYFEHAVREMPLDLVLALCLAGAALHFFPPLEQARRRRLLPAAATAALLAVILAGAWSEGGAGALALNLLQYPTRPGAALEYGSHWHYHLLCRLALLLTAYCAIGVYASFRPQARTGGPGWYLTGLAVYAALSLAFRPRLEPFVDPRYLGHQARELFTHVLVTLPLGLAACAWVAGQFHSPRASAPWRRPRAPVLAAGILAAALGAYLAAGVVLTQPQLQAQSQSLTRLVAVHFFEHTFTYLLTPAAAVFFYLAAGRARSVRPAGSFHGRH